MKLMKAQSSAIRSQMAGAGCAFFCSAFKAAHSLRVWAALNIENTNPRQGCRPANLHPTFLGAGRD